LRDQFAAKKRRAWWLQRDDGAASDRMRATATGLDHDAPMPEPRALSLRLLPIGTSDCDAFRAFVRAMGDETARETEVSPFPGVSLNVSRQMFTDHKTGASKLDKRGRTAYLRYIAETVLRPDEAWAQEAPWVMKRSCFLRATCVAATDSPLQPSSRRPNASGRDRARSGLPRRPTWRQSARERSSTGGPAWAEEANGR
jgi:hypothetical protein